MPLRLTTLLALLLIVLSTAAGTAMGSEKGLERQRQEFRDALAALRKGETARFAKLKKGLESYPLHLYLEYEELRRDLGKVSAQRIERYLDRHAGAAPADRLHTQWLHHLAKHGRWKSLLKYARADESSTTLRCHTLNARIRLGRMEGVWAEVDELWRVGASQPKACDPVFEAWRAAGQMTKEKVLARVALAMERRNLSLTRYLAKLLPTQEREWVERWMQVHRRPDRELAKLDPKGAAQWNATLFAHGVRRLARKEGDQALALWRNEGPNYPLTEEQRRTVERSLGLRLAYRRHDAAADLLAALPDADEETRAWRLRNLIWQRRWGELAQGIAALPAEERDRDVWRYWGARAAEALGRTVEARRRYTETADGNGFYSFLAAERAGIAPKPESLPLDVAAWELAKIADLPEMIRARELFALGRKTDAAREWFRVTREMDAKALATAAKLAHSWGWHDRAILTLGKSGRLDDLELRFPTPFSGQITRAAKHAKLDPALIYATIRQESAFRHDARSPVGALGLMQLMPATAKRTGRLIKRPVHNNWQILDVDTNIRLGSSHLAHLLKRYQGNRILTSVAYNAGPHRINQWRPEDREQPADIWIENVPFDETRGYIKRILAYTLIYEWRLGRPLTPLSRYMPEIEPSS